MLLGANYQSLARKAGLEGEVLLHILDLLGGIGGLRCGNARVLWIVWREAHREAARVFCSVFGTKLTLASRLILPRGHGTPLHNPLPFPGACNNVISILVLLYLFYRANSMVVIPDLLTRIVWGTFSRSQWQIVSYDFCQLRRCKGELLECGRDGSRHKRRRCPLCQRLRPPMRSVNGSSLGAELIARLVQLDVRIAVEGRIQQGLLDAQAAQVTL